MSPRQNQLPERFVAMLDSVWFGLASRIRFYKETVLLFPRPPRSETILIATVFGLLTQIYY